MRRAPGHEVRMFCPQCGARRAGSFRYCQTCSFDFDSLGRLGTSALEEAASSRGRPIEWLATGAVRLTIAWLVLVAIAWLVVEPPGIHLCLPPVGGSCPAWPTRPDWWPWLPLVVGLLIIWAPTAWRRFRAWRRPP